LKTYEPNPERRNLLGEFESDRRQRNLENSSGFDCFQRINNKHAATVSILPITSTTAKIYPFEIFLTDKRRKFIKRLKAKANQIRTIDKQRIGNKIEKISKSKLNEIENAILIHLGIEK